MKVKKQHFVPRFYLKNFSKDNHQIEVFDKSENKSFSSNINDIAFKKYLYDYNSLDKETGKQTIENQLSKLEALHAIQFRRFIQNLKSRITGLDQTELKISLSEFIGIQLWRTPRSFDSMNKLINQIDKGLANKGWEIDRWVKDLENFHPLEQFNFHLLDFRKQTLLLFDKIWVVWMNKSSTNLLTSDNPTVGYFEPVNKGHEIYFPINPKFSISLFDKIKYNNYKELDGKIIPLEYFNVIYYNDLIFKSSIRHCFSIENDFDYLKTNL